MVLFDVMRGVNNFDLNCMFNQVQIIIIIIQKISWYLYRLFPFQGKINKRMTQHLDWILIKLALVQQFCQPLGTKSSGEKKKSKPPGDPVMLVAWYPFYLLHISIRD